MHPPARLRSLLVPDGFMLGDVCTRSGSVWMLVAVAYVTSGTTGRGKLECKKSAI